VIEWAERWLDMAGTPPPGARFRFVKIETISETERRITYEDIGP